MKEKGHILILRLLQLIFHPFAMACYAAIVVIQSNVIPFFFVSPQIKHLLIMFFVWILFIFPAISLILLKRRDAISSYSMLSTTDLRPTITIYSFFCLVATSVFSMINIPFYLKVLPALSIINSLFYYIINFKIKLNIYTLALSSLLTYFIYVSIAYHHNLLFVIIANILVIGIVNYTFIEENISTLKSSLSSMLSGVLITTISLFTIVNF